MITLLVSIILLYTLVWYTKTSNEPFAPITMRSLTTTERNTGTVLISNSQGNYQPMSLYNMAFPKGTILMWNSTNKDELPPTGWALCDGSNGTPDMTNKFPVGFVSDNSLFNEIGKTGGTETHKLTINQIPAHSHTIISAKNTGYKGVGGGSEISCINSDSVWWTTRETDSSIDSAAQTSHNNMPPYCVIKFIMKL